VHLSIHAETAFRQEIVRAHYFGWYRHVADGLPPLDNGWITPAETPGHGVTLREEFLSSDETIHRTATS
jgi:galactonate dehydratase